MGVVPCFLELLGEAANAAAAHQTPAHQPRNGPPQDTTQKETPAIAGQEDEPAAVWAHAVTVSFSPFASD